jgi:hypothetical protein
MIILRFIGRILSIGFILFIAFIFLGKNAEANGGPAPSVSSCKSCENYDQVFIAFPAPGLNLCR